MLLKITKYSSSMAISTTVSFTLTLECEFPAKFNQKGALDSAGEFNAEARTIFGHFGGRTKLCGFVKQTASARCTCVLTDHQRCDALTC